MQDKSWIRKLNSENKGLWSLIYPHGCEIDINKLTENIRRDVETIMIAITCDLTAYRNDFFKGRKQALEHDCNSLWVYVINFGDLPANKQCSVVKQSRSFQEEENKLSCKFIFCGSLNYYVFKDSYLHIHGKTNSPPLQSKDIIRVPPATTQDIIDAYNDVLLIPKKPSRLDNIYLNFFIEQTGGDFFLINKSIEHLRQIGQDWKSNIEQVLSELVDSESVTDAIQSRLELLDTEAKSLLIKLLLFHRLIRNLDDSVAEQLWVTGIVKSIESESAGKRYIQLASPVVEIVVRKLYHARQPKIIAPPDEICFKRSSPTVEAFSLITEIEVLLRNLVFTSWYKQFGEEWYKQMYKIKTISHEEQDSQDMQALVATMVDSRLVIAGFKVDNSIPGSSEKILHQGAAKETIYASANNWRVRKATHHAVELASQSLMQFLTTEELVSILMCKSNGFHGQDKPFVKQFLYSVLDDYIQIRSSVAHNQSVKINTIQRLQEILQRLVHYITVFADRTTKI